MSNEEIQTCACGSEVIVEGHTTHYYRNVTLEKLTAAEAEIAELKKENGQLAQWDSDNMSHMSSLRLRKETAEAERDALKAENETLARSIKAMENGWKTYAKLGNEQMEALASEVLSMADTIIALRQEEARLRQTLATIASPLEYLPPGSERYSNSHLWLKSVAQKALAATPAPAEIDWQNIVQEERQARENQLNTFVAPAEPATLADLAGKYKGGAWEEIFDEMEAERTTPAPAEATDLPGEETP